MNRILGEVQFLSKNSSQHKFCIIHSCVRHTCVCVCVCVCEEREEERGDESLYYQRATLLSKAEQDGETVVHHHE